MSKRAKKGAAAAAVVLERYARRASGVWRVVGARVKCSGFVARRQAPRRRTYPGMWCASLMSVCVCQESERR